ncbi:site-specific integrase [Ralstonia sp.]|uniref:tyrosine-type recombinase/integrase n=1 Tax=Ralstonia sp. TaxID=54061 RepID=UPI0031D38560
MAAKTAAMHENYLSSAIVPKLGAMLVADVTGADVVTMIESVKRPWITSSYILNTTRRLFSHAIGKRIITTSPCAGIEISAILGPKPSRRPRVMLTDVELRAIFACIDSMGRQNGLNFRVQLATGVRSGELCRSMWDEFDLDAGVWTIPKGRIKTRASNPRAFKIPLAVEVVAWLKELKDIAGLSPYVLPGRQEQRAESHQAENTFGAAVERFQLANPDICQRFTPHDLRSTARSHMGALGVASDIAERALNHVIPGMEGVYDKGDYFPERKQALELWARFLATCERGEGWNVIPIARKTG